MKTICAYVLILVWGLAVVATSGCATKPVASEPLAAERVESSPDVVVDSRDPPPFEVFDESKIQESVAPSWTQYAIVFELCGERLAIEYIGGEQVQTLRPRNAKTLVEKAEIANAFREFDAVVAHQGRAHVARLDDSCQ